MKAHKCELFYFAYQFMKFVIVRSYDNYIPAHIDMGRLKEDGINCWLRDENSVTIDPFLSNAIGGIKLMVPENQVELAIKLLNSDAV